MPLLESHLPVKSSRTYFCIAYERDFEEAYAFYCARYKDISLKEFLGLGMTEFNMKLNSIPESEPLFTILKSRVVNTAKIKDKEQRKYWNELKRKNRIPAEYLSTREILAELNSFAKEKKI